MTACLMLRPPPNRRLRPFFYRVEIVGNLFGEFSVVREWGRLGGRARERVELFEGLLEASRAADRYRRGRLRRGYARIA
ncbi:WGR domain-containing protein [Roseobacter sp. HKCCA0434]|uniref:WGR domain-containing protein n=1 Tax=Roseobacter sp. HKCCA0434 TaxID=3079297 RepID=UPI002905ED62|nr:WGR domain-containing protein [Roseobacter sp. HKCCA0434]